MPLRSTLIANEWKCAHKKILMHKWCQCRLFTCPLSCLQPIRNVLAFSLLWSSTSRLPISHIAWSLLTSSITFTHWAELPMIVSFDSLHDQLPHPHRDGGPASPGEDLHLQEANTLLKLDRGAHQRYHPPLHSNHRRVNSSICTQKCCCCFSNV